MLSAPSKWPFRSTRIYLISSLGFCHSFTSCSVCSHDCFFSKLWLFSNFSIRVRLHSICPKVVLSLLFARKQNLNVPIVQKGRLHILTSQQCINKQKANPKQHYVLLLLREEWLSPPDPPHWKVKADTSPSLHTTVLAEIFLSPYPAGVAFLPKKLHYDGVGKVFHLLQLTQRCNATCQNKESNIYLRHTKLKTVDECICYIKQFTLFWKHESSKMTTIALFKCALCSWAFLQIINRLSQHDLIRIALLHRAPS